MRVIAKIRGGLLDHVRRDLARPHAFAHERVGFLTACVAAVPLGVLLAIRDYLPVADGDYEPDPHVGARIGSSAMRKATQAAYRPPLALVHIHSHGGRGEPRFSPVDLRSADEFVPGFFGPMPRMPHGLIVLSNDSAHGLLWHDSGRKPVRISDFVRVGAPYKRSWGTA